MNVQIRAKDITLHDNIRAHIESAIDGFSKYTLDITTVNVNIKAEKKGVSIEFDIHIAHCEPVIINQTDDNLDAAIDLAIDRASKALRRLHTKVVDHKKTSVKDL
jgi:ribosomal subunit interface protein